MAWIPLGFFTLFLARFGYLPVPGTAAAITLAHVPVILGGVLCGPLAGLLLGLLFGVINCWTFAPHDPLVQILPRVLCGLVAAAVFWLVRRHGNPHSQLTVGSVLAALSGSLTNTLGVVGLGLVKGVIPGPEVPGVILFHGAPEALLAVLVTLPFAVSKGHG